MIDVIPLQDGSKLNRVGCGIWDLYRGDNFIRTLDKYECGFINDTIFAVACGIPECNNSMLRPKETER